MKKTESTSSENVYDIFDTIRSPLGLNNKKLLEFYLRRVFKDLSQKKFVVDSKELDDGISKPNFIEYMNLPVFLSEKIFYTIKTTPEHKNIQYKDFLSVFKNIYIGDFDKTSRIVFNIFDFDKDGIIFLEDVRILLKYATLDNKSNNRNQVWWKYVFSSIEDVEGSVYSLFNEKRNIDINDFYRHTVKTCPRIFFGFISFLYLNIPFNSNTVNAFEFELEKRNKKKITVDSLLGETEKKVGTTDKDSKSSSEQLQNSDPFKMPTLSSTSENSIVINVIRSTMGISNVLDNIMTSKTKGIRDLDEKENDQVTLELAKKRKASADSDKSDKIKLNEICNYNETLYYLTNKHVLKKFYATLLGKDMMLFKYESQDKLIDMQNLSGSIVVDNGKYLLDGKEFYSFSLHYPEAIYNFFCESGDSHSKWIENIKLAIKTRRFLDDYEIVSNIGEGSFGYVKLAKNRATKQEVALKIIPKEKKSKNPHLHEFVQTEVDILKNCNHKNIVKLIDYYEDHQYYLIVLEYLSGRNLGTYLSSKKEEYEKKVEAVNSLSKEKGGKKYVGKCGLSEKMVAFIVQQVAEGLYYLNSMGIVHRDLKAENIMFSDNSNFPLVKLMDFGLSKVIGDNERLMDGFGSLFYVAPEVIMHKPYGKEVDIWSLGILIYYLLTGNSPFFGANKIDTNPDRFSRKIIKAELIFDSGWTGNSNEAKQLIEGCLKVNPKDRLTLKELLSNKWVTNNF